MDTRGCKVKLIQTMSRSTKIRMEIQCLLTKSEMLAAKLKSNHSMEGDAFFAI